MDTFTVTFWGVRGSRPTPQFSHFRYGGNTSCVEVNAGGQTIILDAGSGLADLSHSLACRARQAGERVDAVLLFSHLHHDHTQGLPFFYPAFNPRNRIHLFGPDLTGDGFPHDIQAVIMPPYFPLSMKAMAGVCGVQDFLPGHVLLLGGGLPAPLLRSKEARPVSGEEDMVRVEGLFSREHPNDVLYYRIGYRGRSLVYASDREPEAVRGIGAFSRFAHRADLLIHDAQFTEAHYFGLQPDMPCTKGWGHSYTKMACQAALAAGARRLALTHYDPHYDDATVDEIGRRAQSWYDGAQLAYEGLHIDLMQSAPAPRVPRPDYRYSELETQPAGA
ncbi:MAG: MBL fold metallo-hydrolase [Chloroflexi bacterium]|nr:MBL fold metallo-hydrolase [Chloroflexota bacterium]